MATTPPVHACPMTAAASAATWVRARAHAAQQDRWQGWWCRLCSHSSHLAIGWRLFDDSTVTTVDESQVVTRYAYVLFYRRRNSPVERPPRAGHSEHHPDLGPAAEAAASQVRHGVGSFAD